MEPMEATDSEKDLYDELIEYILKDKRAGSICRELSSIWTELWDEEEINKRKQILSEKFEEEIYAFLEDVAIKEKETRDEYIKMIERLLGEIKDLQENLEIAIPYEDVENLPLHKMAFHLNKKAEKYRLIKCERIEKMEQFLANERELCKKLETLPMDMKFSSIPTKRELKQLENHISAMKQEITNRSLALAEKSQKIATLFDELDIKPTLIFEKDIISPDSHENFIFSNENMKLLDDILTRLEHQVEDSKQTKEELHQKLNTVWDYLDEPDEHRQQFLESHPGHSIPIITALKGELNRCEAKKRENISKIIGKMRQVLVEEWDKCLIAKDEREKFRPYYINCFTQDLCELHELEIERLRNFYRNNEQIFNLLAKHEKLFQKLIDLENTSKNTNRYYNRGGQLLQEERERKLITKELPIVEEELRELLKKYEDDHGKPFESFGVPLLLILDEQWNAHFDKKTIDKLARKKGSEKKSKTPLGKRTLITPKSSVASKVSKLTGEKIVSSTTKCNTPLVPSRPVRPRRKILLDDQPDSTFQVDPTYDEFQNNLQTKIESAKKTIKAPIRSTAVKEAARLTATITATPTKGVLREKNTPVILRSATAMVKTTPAKLAKTPMYSPSVRKTPRTIPRQTRRQSQANRLTPAVNRLPLII